MDCNCNYCIAPKTKSATRTELVNRIAKQAAEIICLKEKLIAAYTYAYIHSGMSLKDAKDAAHKELEKNHGKVI